MSDSMTIGGLASETGVKIPTIRYYESIGLLPRTRRTEGNRRVYGPAAVERLRFIRHARELGFEVQAIHELLDLAGSPKNSCGEVDTLARQHLQTIVDRIKRLTTLKRELESMIRSCAKGRIEECRILSTLSRG